MSDDSIKLIKLRDPEPSNHPDERMHWTLGDVRRLFPTGPGAAEESRPGPIHILHSKA